ncbi:hypothetical protein SNEBB_008362 [Seison nebaliae]|nr:hypothetical protein SNEBB_008362 [Seison nebaliae]
MTKAEDVRMKLRLTGELVGHKGWVTQIATVEGSENTLISTSRDKTLMVWDLNDIGEDDQIQGTPKVALRGHNHFVSDVAISTDGKFALSSSWDQTLRLWDLQRQFSTRRFVGHTGDVLSAALSPDNRQIISGSRDKTIKLWNTIAECKYTITSKMGSHNDWVSCVRFTSQQEQPLIVSSGWDKLVKVWNLNEWKIKATHFGHIGYVNCVTISPDATLCGSGGKGGKAFLWDLNDDKYLYPFHTEGDSVNALVFSPNRYWFCGAVDGRIRLWDLETQNLFDEVPQPNDSTIKPICTSLAWNLDGSKLYAGYTDNKIRVYAVETNAD